MICEKCGKDISDLSKFCPECGYQISVDKETKGNQNIETKNKSTKTTTKNHGTAGLVIGLIMLPCYIAIGFFSIANGGFILSDLISLVFLFFVCFPILGLILSIRALCHIKSWKSIIGITLNSICICISIVLGCISVSATKSFHREKEILFNQAFSPTVVETERTIIVDNSPETLIDTYETLECNSYLIKSFYVSTSARDLEIVVNSTGNSVYVNVLSESEYNRKQDGLDYRVLTAFDGDNVKNFHGKASVSPGWYYLYITDYNQGFFSYTSSRISIKVIN